MRDWEYGEEPKDFSEMVNIMLQVLLKVSVHHMVGSEQDLARVFFKLLAPN